MAKACQKHDLGGVSDTHEGFASQTWSYLQSIKLHLRAMFYGKKSEQQRTQDVYTENTLLKGRRKRSKKVLKAVIILRKAWLISSPKKVVLAYNLKLRKETLLRRSPTEE